MTLYKCFIIIIIIYRPTHLIADTLSHDVAFVDNKYNGKSLQFP